MLNLTNTEWACFKRDIVLVVWVETVHLNSLHWLMELINHLSKVVGGYEILAWWLRVLFIMQLVLRYREPIKAITIRTSVVFLGSVFFMHYIYVWSVSLLSSFNAAVLTPLMYVILFLVQLVDGTHWSHSDAIFLFERFLLHINLIKFLTLSHILEIVFFLK